jgi:LysM repeat protein
MSYGIWLSFNNEKEGFQLPENPESIEISNGASNSTHHISGLGEVNVLKDPNLSEFSFSGTFPAVRNPYVVANKMLAPGKIKDYLLKWQASKKPVRFIFTGSTFDINTLVSIEEFNWKEEGGSVGDIQYELNLKKYVSYAPQKVKIKVSSANKVTAKKSTKPRADNREQVKVYKLVKGDSLWKVAKKFLGSGTRYPEIAKLNNIKPSQYRRLPIGLAVKIPPK